jgi:hypothetical protein
MGFKPADVEYLLMGAARGLGTYDLNKVEIVGDELDRLARKFGKPQRWYARCNREWRVSRDPDLDLSISSSRMAATQRHVSFGDILYADKALGGPATALAAVATVKADGHRKGYLWLGFSGKMAVQLNGEKILEEQSTLPYRVGQVKQAVELRPGRNQLIFRLRAAGEKLLQMSAVLVSPANNGDSLDGIRWSA